MALHGLKLTDETDAALVALASDKGEQAAFLVLYDRYKTAVTLHVGSFVTRREDVEDIVLESFQKAFSQIASYNPEYKFSTWIYRIARNTAFDYIDRQGRQDSNMPLGSLDDERAGFGSLAALGGDPESEVISSQGYEALVKAINSLPVLYRDVARMVLLENYGYEEVAKATGLPLNTVRTRVRRSRENLSRLLEGAGK